MSKIRTATAWDIDIICDLLKNYRGATPWDRLKDCDNKDYIQKLLTQILVGMGQIWLSEEDNIITGMLIAIRNHSIWDPNIWVMHELAYWVEPEYRGGTAGYKLLKSYVDYCQEQKDLGVIDSFTLSKMTNSPDLNYGRYGLSKLEETWRA
jgi:N-acetylglutamate synthase-like GNAT family acetyltransferase